ncbi:MAG: hypothetical protein NZM43_08950 [Saprospiraceae bacterium]|nr:hypothetical protein [Saprospiraceae bacterium]MDW8484440.1 hypothetical protein [Saprospiraceae bacterium]
MFEQNIFQGPGTGTYTTHTFEILLMLLVAALIGLWLGWLLWSRYRQRAEQLETENASLAATAQALRKELEVSRARQAELETTCADLEVRTQSLSQQNNNLQEELRRLYTELNTLRAINRRYASELGMSLEPDTPSEEVPLEIAPSTEDGGPQRDLESEVLGTASPEHDQSQPKVVPLEGRDIPLDVALTPEQEDLDLLPSDVCNFGSSSLSEKTSSSGVPSASTETIRFIEPVPRGTMVALEALSDPPVLTEEMLSAGKSAASEDIEQGVPRAVAADVPYDDLKRIEGIGPQIEQLLFSKGITTYGQLAATSVQQLKDILAEAGPHFAMHDPGTWSAQALLAANGEWENLKAYQDFLHGGKRPRKS